MAALALNLLGALTITPDGEPVTRLESDKVRALLVRLALEPERTFRREVLSVLLWPEAAPAHAAQNLRQALYNLRRAIGETFLRVTPQTVQFNATDVTMDVFTWRRLWDETLQHRHRRRETCRRCLARLAEAVALYRGDLLAGFALKDCPEIVVQLLRSCTPSHIAEICRTFSRKSCHEVVSAIFTQRAPVCSTGSRECLCIRIDAAGTRRTGFASCYCPAYRVPDSQPPSQRRHCRTLREVRVDL